MQYPLPLALQESSLIVVMAEPQNLQFLDELRFKSGKKVIPRLGFRSEIALAIDRHYGLVSPEPSGPLARSLPLSRAAMNAI